MNVQFVKNEQGFTLIEMLISMAIFGFLVFAVIAVYLSFNNSQIHTTVSQQLLNDSQYAMELMSREIRNNTIVKYSFAVGGCNTLINTSDPLDVFDDCIFLEKENGQTFAFTRHQNNGGPVSLLYMLLYCDDTYTTCNITAINSNSTIELMSPNLNNTEVTKLNFYITPNSDPFISGGPDQQPKVTINMETSYITGNISEKATYTFQTTVSSRIYKR